MKPTAQYRFHRRTLALSAAAILVAPALAPPAQAQDLFGRIGRALERAEKKATDIQTSAASLERSVTQVKQAADEIDRTADTASAILGTAQRKDDATDAGLDGDPMADAMDWSDEDAGMMPDQQGMADTAEPITPEAPAPDSPQPPPR